MPNVLPRRALPPARINAPLHKLCHDHCASITRMEHPTPIRPEDYAVYSPDKMGKSTLFRSECVMVGLNAFEPGQEHALHAHDGMDKVYRVIEARGCFCSMARPFRCRRESCWWLRKGCPTASAIPGLSACSFSSFWHRRRNSSIPCPTVGSSSLACEAGRSLYRRADAGSRCWLRSPTNSTKNFFSV